MMRPIREGLAVPALEEYIKVHHSKLDSHCITNFSQAKTRFELFVDNSDGSQSRVRTRASGAPPRAPACHPRAARARVYACASLHPSSRPSARRPTTTHKDTLHPPPARIRRTSLQNS